MTLLLMWVLYAVVGVTVFSALFFWAVRSGQFRDQQRARTLPLECPSGEEIVPEPGRSDSVPERVRPGPER